MPKTLSELEFDFENLSARLIQAEKTIQILKHAVNHHDRVLEMHFPAEFQRNCEHCGRKLNERDRKCRMCGKKVAA